MDRRQSPGLADAELAACLEVLSCENLATGGRWPELCPFAAVSSPQRTMQFRDYAAHETSLLIRRLVSQSAEQRARDLEALYREMWAERKD